MRNLLTNIRTLSFAALWALSISCFGQDSLTSDYKNGKFLIGPYATNVSIQEFSQKYAVGISCEYFLGRNFSFGAYAGGGADYAEFSGAILGLPLFLLMNVSNNSSSAGNSNNLFIFILTLALTLENPTIYFDNHHYLALSLNLLKFRYLYEKNGYYGEDNTFASGSVTLRLKFFTQKNWEFSFFGEGSALYYKGNPTGFQLGLAARHLSRKP